jgi:aldehyde:ferredoxin oxidoreductase
MEEPLPEGMAKRRVITPKMYDEMLDEYYLERGWNERGIPNPETLERLGLHHLFTTSP